MGEILLKPLFGLLEKVADNVTNKEPLYCLLLGVNDRQGQSLTDTIMCFGYNPGTGKAFIVSIPRDTFVRK